MKVIPMDDEEIFESEGLVNLILDLAVLPDPRMVPKEVLQKSIDNAKNSILRAMARARQAEREKFCEGCQKPCLLEGRPDSGHPVAEFCPVCVQEKEKQAYRQGMLAMFKELDKILKTGKFESSTTMYTTTRKYNELKAKLMEGRK